MRTVRAAISICPAGKRCFPFMVPVTQPPDFLTAFLAESFRFLVAILCRMPLTSNIGVVAQEVVLFGHSLSTVRAASSICPVGNHCFPFMLPLVFPPGFLTTHRGYITRGQASIPGRMLLFGQRWVHCLNPWIASQALFRKTGSPITKYSQNQKVSYPWPIIIYTTADKREKHQRSQ